MKQRWIAVAQAFKWGMLFWLLAAGVVSQANAQNDKPTEIRIGVPDQSAGNKPFIAGPLGLAHIQRQFEQAFEPQGIKIKWSFFKGAGPAVNEALANRQLDIAYLGDLAAIIGRAGGLQTRFLLGVRGSHSYLAATPESGIKTLADIKGKRVAVYRGTADQLAFDRALASVGLSERDVRVINLDWAAGRAALAARRIDAVWGGVSLLTLREQGIAIVADSGELGRANTTQAGVVATQDFITHYPQVTQQLVDILVQNAHWISQPDNTAAYVEKLEAQSWIPQALFLAELQPAELNFRSSPRLDAFLQASLQDSVDRAKAAGLIRTAFTVDSWFDGQFVEQALKTLQLEPVWPRYGADGQAVPQ
ncbi:ABC transporter substrate-binding protein [Gibbsiella dentisursi]|uniref:ABC transporter substrate-binding protein n=1 Tax=Gibbsiella dentisursi TaxID=796890 RepID=A0ABP7KM11_9GAMM